MLTCWGGSYHLVVTLIIHIISDHERSEQGPGAVAAGRGAHRSPGTPLPLPSLRRDEVLRVCVSRQWK